MVNSGNGPQWPLIKLVETCRSIGIPTVFWNKEDPPHFREYLPTAKLFDFVLTSDGDMVSNYCAKTSARGVELLRFAANPRIHNPSQVDGYRGGDIAFAGQYFADKFPERRQQMQDLFGPAQMYDFSIYSRGLGGKDIYQFPDPWDQYVVGSLPYEEMVKAYRRHKIFLNVNSVTSSSTMCARRIFELSAAKTAVVGMHSEAVRSVYTDEHILLATKPSEVADIYEYLLAAPDAETNRKRIVQRAWRHTLSHHTYRHRLQQIAELVGIAPPVSKIEVLVFADGPSSTLLKDIESQQFTLSEKVQIRIHNINDDVDDGFDSFSASGDKENRFIAFMSEQYRYGPFYLNDLLLSSDQQSAKFVAKTLSVEDKMNEETWSDTLPKYGWLARLDGETPRDFLVFIESGQQLAKGCTVYLSDAIGIDIAGRRRTNPLFTV
ncbi:glycosyltransferase [Brevibacterium sp. UMB1308A]|uniref:CgeB family protein n=1 Tax=Brevibacterium sp. UMB1308A TaxID=3050608 RepID=UPI00255069C2|nr:glycosyltransferase [Brevibacterium sp. UMB1308A]MDK8346583.1 glycosyltransferase [Brevibacterium sp. UMB1308B]MDK8713492.1 glycosyltransferase [Brevibacterium sp. UMB1308A]